MKYHIKKTKDNFPLNEEHAIELAKKQLAKTGYFAAIYGKNVNGKKEFHTPILVSESSLRSAKNELLNEDPNSALYAVYREHIDDAPTYEVEYRGGEAYLDLPDEEVSNFIKGKMQEIIDNPRLYQKYKYELEDLFEEDLQRYVDEQFYQKGRGEVYKDSKNDHPSIVLNYEDLELELTGDLLYHESMEGPAEYDDFETTEDYEYEVDPDDVEEALYNILKEKYKDKSDEEIDKFIDENYENLTEQYEDDLKDYFRDKAIDKATEYYQEKLNNGDYDDYE